MNANNKLKKVMNEARENMKEYENEIKNIDELLGKLEENSKEE